MSKTNSKKEEKKQPFILWSNDKFRIVCNPTYEVHYGKFIFEENTGKDAMGQQQWTKCVLVNDREKKMLMDLAQTLLDKIPK